MKGGPDETASQSLKQGSASFCNVTGVSSESIKLMGNWRSFCYSVYTDNNVNNVNMCLEIVRSMQENVR